METILNHAFAHQKYFEEMTRIPHGSFHEEAYSAYLEEFAKAHQFTYERDEMNNAVSYTHLDVYKRQARNSFLQHRVWHCLLLAVIMEI